MTCDSHGRPICPICERPFTRARRIDQSFVLTCEACGVEDAVPISQLRAEQRQNRAA